MYCLSIVKSCFVLGARVLLFRGLDINVIRFSYKRLGTNRFILLG